MQHKSARVLIGLLGALFGIGLLALVSLIPAVDSMIVSRGPFWLPFAAYPVVFILFGIFTYLLSERVISTWINAARRIDQRLGQMQMADLIFGGIGLLAGLMVAFLLSALLRSLPYPLYLSLSLVLYIVCGGTCSRIALKRWHELPFLTQYRRADGAPSPRSQERAERKAARAAAREEGGAAQTDDDLPSPPKLLDSSVLIDGRIVDICKTGFLEGRLIVPQFILEELQRVADSADSLKRRRGRRGLDVVAELQGMESVNIESGGYGDSGEDEVDMKLLKLTRRLNGLIMTNDYNLNKVAELSGVHVLNINELANALKPALLPGEEMAVTVLKEGKEYNQGVGYLEDGTMIVVENGRELIGSTVHVAVTSVLQTAAGRMIFAKPKEQSA